MYHGVPKDYTGRVRPWSKLIGSYPQIIFNKLRTKVLTDSLSMTQNAMLETRALNPLFLLSHREVNMLLRPNILINFSFDFLFFSLLCIKCTVLETRFYLLSD